MICRRVCGWRGGGGVGDSQPPVDVDGREGAELQAIDVSENSRAASGDAIGGQEPVEVVKGIVNALSGLKALATVGKIGIEVGVLLLLELGVMKRTKSGAEIRGQETALAPRRSAMATTSGR